MKNVLLVAFVLLSGMMATAQTDYSKIDLTGRVTLKNDVPEPIQMTLFEGDFQKADRDASYDALKGALEKQDITLLSEIFYSVKEGKPNLLLMIVNAKQVDSILILDLAKGERYLYNISRSEANRLVSSDPNYSDYILDFKK